MPHPSRSTRRRTGVRDRSRALLVLLLAAMMLWTPVRPSGLDRSVAAPQAPAPADAISAQMGSDFVSVPTDGNLDLSVRSRVTTDMPYLEARFQVLRADGGVMLQKTEIRHDVEPGDITLRFSREIASLGLAPAEHEVRVRVRSSDTRGQTYERLLQSTLFVYDPKAPPAPVSVVVRLAGSPARDPEGRFADDPAVNTVGRDQALALARELGDGQSRFSLAIPPLLLDDWRRASQGYVVAGPEGEREVGADSPAAIAYASALRGIAALAGQDRVELLNVPYADPDLLGMNEAGVVDDLGHHYALGLSSYLASLEQTPSLGTSLRGEVLPPSALPSLTRGDISYALVSPSSIGGAKRQTESGAYRVEETTLTAVVIDERLSKDLAEDQAEAMKALFARYLESGSEKAAVAVLTLGPGRSLQPEQVASTLAVLDRVPWLRTVTVAEAAAQAAEGTIELAEPRREAEAPTGYWDEVVRARRWAAALSSAAGENDAETEAAWYAVMLAESAGWAGADGSWSLADRGRAFSASAERRARQLLEQVTVDAQDVTLSGRDGEVPVSLTNRSEHVLRVSVRVDSDTLDFPRGDARRIDLRPADNYLTFPVDLNSALSGRLRVSVVAGDITLAQTYVTVQASYLDRIAIVVAVVLVLLGMLFFIKRRVDTADADIIRNGRSRV